MIFDTHTHYDDKIYDEDRDKLLLGLASEGVGRVCNVGSNFKGALDSVTLSQNYEFIYAAVGIHPDEVYDFYQDIDEGRNAEAVLEEMSALGRVAELNLISASEAHLKEKSALGRVADLQTIADLEKQLSLGTIADLKTAASPVFASLRELAGHAKVVAIGEIGLDYHGFGKYEVKPGRALQRYWFLQQLKLAIEFGKPAVIHSRNAAQDTMDMLTKAHQDGLMCADIHCFSYSREQALKYLEMGFYLGIGGVITYEGEKKLTKVIESAPMDRILLETDCPYLTPVPVRQAGSYIRNASPNLKFVVEKIAAIKGVSTQDVEDITWENANRFYGI